MPARRIHRLGNHFPRLAGNAMFLCCCTSSENETEVKPIRNTDEQSPNTGMLSEEEVPTPGFPTAASIVEPPLGRIDEEGDARNNGRPEAQSPSGETFLVTLHRPLVQAQVVDSLFGITLFYSDAANSLEIIDVDVNNESVAAHCRSAPKGRQLEVGELILAVNGVSDSVALMLAAWKDTTEVNCVVCKPAEFTIEVIKIDGGMGIDVTHSTKGCSLLIEGIQAGPVRTWNRSNPEKATQVGDRIVAINGIRGSPTELKEALRAAAGKISLVIARRP